MRASSRRAEEVQLPIIPQVADWIRSHPGTLSLGQGVAGYPPPAEAWTALERMAKDPGLHRYSAVEGHPELLAALGEKLRRRNGIVLDSTRALLVTAGANAGFLQVVLALCDPGDEVILPLPYYFNQEMALALANVRPVLVASDRNHRLDVDAIAGAITPRTRAVVTISPNNPTGVIHPERTLRAINDLCGRLGLYHISDETYEVFRYDGHRVSSPGSFAGAGPHTVSLFSFSKAYGLASWRVGYVVMPAGLRESMRKIQDTNLICPPVVSQLAALGCLHAGEAWLETRLAEVAATRRCVLAGLREGEGVAEVGPAEGAFYLLLRVDTVLDSLGLTRALIEKHRVAVMPGVAFGMKDGCLLRIAYGALTPETATEGIGRLTQGLRALVTER